VEYRAALLSRRSFVGEASCSENVLVGFALADAVARVMRPKPGSTIPSPLEMHKELLT
jgi:hypothetical protein